MRTTFAALLALAMAVTAGPAHGTDPGPGEGAHYIVFALDEDDIPRPISYQLVRLASRPRSKSDAEIADLAGALALSPRDSEPIVVRLLTNNGAPTFQDAVSVVRWARLEQGLYAATAAAAPQPAPLAQRAFVVRVPLGKERRLELSTVKAGPKGRTLSAATRFDLPALATDPALAVNAPAPQTSALSLGAASGPPSNRLDLLVMGDGYTAAEQTKFNADAASLLNAFFDVSPYSDYRTFVNTATLFTPSPQSGADHPPYDPACAGQLFPTCCPDAQMQSDPLAGRFVNTAFDATFCSFATHRLLVVNNFKVLTAAAASPSWDQILVLVNDATYGGAGGGLSVVSTHGSAVEIARHEFGHVMTRLADEYSNAYPGYPACSDVSGTPCEPNVTDQTLRAAIKWNPWISAQTPIPTPGSAPNVLGLFEGARYLETGMYRPQGECKMRSLGAPFCKVCAQEYVLRLYRGGFGIPASGIDNIEPGSESPAPGAVSVPVGNSATFQVGLLQPVGNTVSVTWTVNNVPVGTGASFTFTPPDTGTYTVRATSHDATPLVNAAMAGSDLDSTRTWTVHAIGSGVCAPSATALCLNASRFRVEVSWRVPNQGLSDVGTAIELTPDTGYFWFFASANVELMIKVLDGRPLNGKFWVFYGALSNVEYTITVTDTATGAVKTYLNPSGTQASVADTSAF